MSVRSYLDCSTLYLSEATRDGLDEGDVYATMRGPHGWLVWAGDPDDPELHPTVPDDLARVLKHARGLGCAYVMLDADGPTVDGLALPEGGAT